MRRTALLRFATTPFGFLTTLLLVMWLVEVVDTVVLGDALQGGGIHPRRIDGIDGILWAPFLHASWGHIASNTVPWLTLGGLVSVRGWHHLITVMSVALVAGGGATWLFAGGLNHVGASGIVFGFFGALIGATFFERRPAAVGPALIVIMLYSSMLIGLVPQQGISWEGHLFGMLAGIFAAKIVAQPRRRDVLDEPEPWEADEPWLDHPPQS